MADIEITGADHSEELAQLTEWIEQIRKKKNAVSIGIELTATFDLLLALIKDWEAQGGLNEARLKAIEEFIKEARAFIEEVKAFIEKFKDVDPSELDPEKIRQKVLDSLAEWQKGLEKAIKDLGDIVEDHGKRLTELEDFIKTLDLEKLGADILAKVLEALKTWRETVDKEIKFLKEELGKHADRLTTLESGLKELADKVNGIDFEKLDPEKIRQKVLESLADWQKQIKDSVDALDKRFDDFEEVFNPWKEQVEDRIKSLEGRAGLLEKDRDKHAGEIKDLQDLIKQLDLKKLKELLVKIEELLARPWPDPEKIKQEILDALAEWRKMVEDHIAASDKKLKEHDEKFVEVDEAFVKVGKTFEKVDHKFEAVDKAIAELKRRLDELVIPDAETLKKEILAALEGWKKQISDRIDQLEKETDKKIKEARDESKAGDEAVREELKTAVQSLKDLISSIKTELEGKLKDLGDEAAKTKAELLALIAELDERIDGIEVGGPDPKKVKEIVEKFLEKWKEKLETRINGLDDLIKKLREELNELTKKVNKLDPDKIVQLVLTALKGWRDEIDKAVGKISKIEQDLKELTDRVKTLEDAFAKIDWNELKPEVIRQKVLDALTEWQKSINDLLKSLGDRIDGLDTKIGDVKQELHVYIDGKITDLKNTIHSKTEIEQWIQTAINGLKQILKNELILLLTQIFEKQLSDALKPVFDRIIELEKLPELIKAAQKKADEAFDLATAADKKAGDALTAAGEAKTKAANALTVAGEAKTKAGEAVATAGEAKTKAGEAVATAEEAKTKAEGAVTTAGEAKTKAEGAVTTAGEAKTKAEGAVTTAGEAKTKAEGAVTTAGEAKSKALEAYGIAKEALELARKAQREVDALEIVVQKETEAVRLARRLLDGRGIVQGFEVTHTEQSTIMVMPGTGVTSTGYLIQLDEKRHFTYFRLFTDADKYGDLLKKEFIGKDKKPYYDAWELLTPEMVAEDADNDGTPDVTVKTPLTPKTTQMRQQPFFTDKIVLVLRAHDSEENETTKLRFILVRRHDLVELLNATTTVKRLLGPHPDADFVFSELYNDEDDIPYTSDLHRALHPELVLNEVPLHRFGFRPPKECDPIDLDIPNYPPDLTLDNLYDTYVDIIEDALSLLDKEMDKILRLYQPLLFPHEKYADFTENLAFMRTKWSAYQRHNKRNPWWKWKDEKKKDEKIIRPGNLNTQHYIQYFYDWARDLINAYHELRNELQTLMAGVNLMDGPELRWSEHPKHLMLGPAVIEFNSGMDAPLRHTFVQPPVYNGNAARLEACRLYLRRWFEIVQQFYLTGYVSDPAVNQYIEVEKEAEAALKDLFEAQVLEENEKIEGPELSDDELKKRIQEKLNDQNINKRYATVRITPGKNYGHPLSEQSIPYYYPLGFAPLSLQNLWNYRRAKNQTGDRILSYHANDSDDSYSVHPHVIRPLYYTFDAYDFYRIEGHIGWPTEPDNDLGGKLIDHPCAERLRELKQAYNLDFDIAVLDASPVKDKDGKIVNKNGSVTRVNEKGTSEKPPKELETETEFYYQDDNGLWQKLSELFNPAGKPGPEKNDFNAVNAPWLGIDHIAGVPKGGTFLLVVDKKQVTVPDPADDEGKTTKEVLIYTVIGDFAVPFKVCPKNEISNGQIDPAIVNQAINDAKPGILQEAKNAILGLHVSATPTESTPFNRLDTRILTQQPILVGSILVSVTDCDDKPELNLATTNFGIELFNGLTNKLHVVDEKNIEIEGITELGKTGKYKIKIWFPLVGGEKILNIPHTSNVSAEPPDDIVIGEINDLLTAVVTVKGSNNKNGRTVCEIKLSHPRVTEIDGK